MLGRIRLKACAKINFCLDIVGVRPDGYHLLESVMQSVDLHDIVTVTRCRKPGVRVFCSQEEIPEKSNTAYRAAEVFLREAQLGDRFGAEIHIRKKIPSQAGLGGGSADAAAVLVGLNRLFKTRYSQTQLCAMGAQIGADVPFCVTGGTCLVRGIGEIMTRLDDCFDCFIVIVKGQDGVSTKQAYQDFDEATDLVALQLDKVIEALSCGNFEALKGKLINVFEQSTRVAQVASIVGELRAFGAIEAAMTGSGSAVFGIFQDRKAARRCAAKLALKYPFTCVTRPSVKGIARF